MTRETKVGLLVGMGVILLIGIIVSDHLAVVNEQTPADLVDYAPQAQPSVGAVNHQLAATTADGALRQREPLPIPGQVRRGEDLVVGEPVVPETIIPPAASRTTAVDEPPAAPREGSAPAPTIHYVKNGETLYDIAKRYYGDGNLWRIIARANRDRVSENGRVAVNVRLTVPNISRLATHPDFEPVDDHGRLLATVPGPRGSITTDRGGRFITVQPNQTLSELAAQYLGSSQRWPELLEANRDKLSDPTELGAGMTIRIPGATASAATPAAKPQRQTTAAAQSNTYTVQRGDTLYGIAQRLLGDGEQWSTIYEANRDTLDSPHDLEVGQTLRIPAP
ncbi:MAG: LysM peptidoglycan-binding domain-containing protein [Phycisphaeraceae bacterium]